MRLELLGVRGSTCAPGPEFVRYGGHTSCIAVRPDPTTPPTLVLDAGTGLRTLTPLLDGEPFRGSIVLSHLHWDHMQGLPFFAAGDRVGAEVDLHVPAQDGRTGRDLLAQAFAPPSFPITPEGLHGTWRMHAMESGHHKVEGYDVQAVDVAHKGGRTFGLRVSDGESTVAYVPDHAPAAGMSDELVAMLQGVDVLVHDAQFLDGERPVAVDYGHATVEDCLGLARRFGVGTLVLFHHSPARTDEGLDAIADRAASLADGQAVVLAVQGTAIDVGPHGQVSTVPLPRSSAAR